VSVTRSTAQSLLEYVPTDRRPRATAGRSPRRRTSASCARRSISGVSTRALRAAGRALLGCGMERVRDDRRWRAGQLVNDALYGSSTRHQHAAQADRPARSRMINGLLGIVINTGETTTCARPTRWRPPPSVTASQLSTTVSRSTAAWARSRSARRRVRDRPADEERPAFTSGPRRSSRASCSPLPVKYMPPTRHMDGNLFGTPPATRSST